MKKIVYGNILLFSIALLTSLAVIYFESEKINQNHPITQLYAIASHLVTAASTMLTGLIAAAIYLYQKKDQQLKETIDFEKNVAGLAKIIYLELKKAEAIINEIKQQAILKRQHNNFLTYIDENSEEILLSQTWNTNKHIFINRLSTDEFEHINANYEAAALAESARKLAINVFHTQALEKAASQTRGAIEKSKELASDESLIDANDLNDARDNFDQRFKILVDRPNNLFRPIEQAHMAEKAVEGFNNFINSTTAQTLRKIWDI
ncbi:MAG: hypothetical protein B0W54_23185 [Cellvibrio sp. 79]|nr:MAG: hypothetical protein B0W54_23185 [Cellvibrio sp. 79]